MAWDTDGEHLEMEIPTISTDIYVGQTTSTANEDGIGKLIRMFPKGSIVPSSTTSLPIRAEIDGQVAIKVIQTNSAQEKFADEGDIITHNGLSENCDVRVKLSLGHHHHPSINFIFPTIEERLVN